MKWSMKLNGRNGKGMSLMKKGKGGFSSNVDPGLRVDKMGAPSAAGGGHTEASTGVIPIEHLRKHGLEEKLPNPGWGDPKKQNAESVSADDDLVP